MTLKLVLFDLGDSTRSGRQVNGSFLGERKKREESQRGPFIIEARQLRGRLWIEVVRPPSWSLLEDT